ncbi:MAG: peptidoglycan DD-metalloendopeptidase family protein [Leptospiraceae bacterium]|nr:peptidoglycan DD-metalloendopeptidase family protein [Leptospiraceae bacterium]MCK6379833.1 peptidoglycan DD-metalloendopeptidase family protein [Leptospiraceae bacterium]NUM40975.1 peptidoglycan DD-metalloendopeptidase family protein [Leptospiraceae bacterium]
MQRIFYIIFIFFLVSKLFPDSTGQIDTEISEYTEKENSSFFDSEESKIKEMFSFEENNSDNSSENSEKSQYGYQRLPNSIRVSNILSTKIVRNTKAGIEKYKVGDNETLDGVAKKFRVSTKKIQKTNRLKSTKLKKGQLLKIPIVVPTGSYSRVTKVKVFALPVQNPRISSRFGGRRDPFNDYKKNYHTGLDLAVEIGSPVIASADGVVEFTGRNGGYGNIIIIRHKNGYRTAYAHCADIFAKVGDKVKMGKVIARVGRTGTATGSHLHFEVTLNGRYMNPEKALKKVEIYTSKVTNSVAKL